MSDHVVSCADVGFGYTAYPVLRHVSFSVERGRFFGLVGPNGCGKSTLMRLLLGLLEPTQGHLTVLGRRPVEAVKTGHIGYVPQKDTYQRGFPLAVFDVVMMGRVARCGLGRRPCRHDQEIARATMERLGIGEWARRRFGALSGGQQRLVLLARALCQQPRLLLMDEADTGLDELRRERIYRELNRIREEQDLTIIAISHQMDLLATVVDEAVMLNDGAAVEWCPTCMHHAIQEERPPHLGPVS